MNDNQIERFLTAFELLSRGVDKIGDSLKSIAFYIWLPVYLFLIGSGCAIWYFFYR